MRMAKLAIPVLIALAIIGAACEKEEAEIGGLSLLAPEGVVPAIEEPQSEPLDTPSGQACVWHDDSSATRCRCLGAAVPRIGPGHDRFGSLVKDDLLLRRGRKTR